MLSRILLPVILISLLSACTAQLPYLVDGFYAAKTGDFKKALSLYEDGAKQGDSSCQLMAGTYYYNGIGTEANLLTSVRYYRQAARNKNVAAQQAIPMVMATYVMQSQMGGGSAADGMSLEEALAWAVVAEKNGGNTAKAQQNISNQLGPARAESAMPLVNEYIGKYRRNK